MSFRGYERFVLNLGLILVLLGTSLTVIPVEASSLLLGEASAPSAKYGDPTICTSGPITVVNLSDSGAGSLRQAITDICPGGTINFASLLAGQTILLSSSSLPVIDKPLTIDGGSGGSVILSGAGSYRIFEVTSAGNLTLNNLKLQDGNYKAWCSGGLPGAPSCAGGGIYSEGTLTITNGTFSGNSADAGGAIFIAAGTVEISNSTFANNSAYQGGAIFTWAGTATVLNSTFFANSATYGGAIYSETATLSLSNNTFSNNSATYGGGLYNVGILNLTNNILANSPSGADCFNEDGAGIVVTDVGNLVEVNAAETNNCGTPAATGDPNLGPLASNGGLTRTMALLSGSPAIDAADAAACPVADQRGVSRPQGSACDIGAFEFVTLDTPTPTLTSTVTSTSSPT
ncbi:MAG: choice-of-anchor Q domain-containing protein, partial [Chloroflexota bacterium]